MMVKELYFKNKKFIFYAFFGGMGVLTDLSSYTLLVLISINYQVANAIGYASGTLVSFFLNRKFTFKVKDKIVKRLLSFFGVATLGYVSSAILLYISVENLNINEFVAKILTLFFVLILQYSLNKKITFKG